MRSAPGNSSAAAVTIRKLSERLKILAPSSWSMETGTTLESCRTEVCSSRSRVFWIAATIGARASGHAAAMNRSSVVPSGASNTRPSGNVALTSVLGLESRTSLGITVHYVP